MASGIIEYLAEGAWTKRMHPGWAAQAGYRAARMAQAGFTGPRTLFDGEHGFFHAFANSDDCDFARDAGRRGPQWLCADIAFKPYACGTMAHPYIDCARRLVAEGVAPDDVVAIECRTAEGIVHRLWEPLAAKQNPPNGYAAKFSIPYAIAVGMLRGDAGLRRVRGSGRAAIPPSARSPPRCATSSIPDNPYPRQFTGHVRVTLKSGEVREASQDHFRGGRDEPMSRRGARREILGQLRLRRLGRRSRAHARSPCCARCAPRRASTLARCEARSHGRRHRSRARSRSSPVRGATSDARLRWRSPMRAPKVAVNVRASRDEGQAVVDEIAARGGDALLVVADVTQRGEVDAMIAAIAQRFGRLDIVVNNAAIRHEAAFADLPYADWRAAQAVCVDGAFHCTQAALPLLRDSGAGAVINIGGMTAHTGASMRAHVVTAKAALGGLTRALAHELAPFGITVNCVAPGMIDTVRKATSASANPAHHAGHQPLLGRRGRPDEIASAVVWLAGPGGRFTTGQTLHVNGGAYLGG